MKVVCGKCGRKMYSPQVGIRVVDLAGMKEEEVRPYQLSNADEFICTCGMVVWAGFGKPASFDADPVGPWDELYELVKEPQNHGHVRVEVEVLGVFPTKHFEQMMALMSLVQEHRKERDGE